MAHIEPRLTLVGRSRECDAIERVIASLRGGQSRALVIRADAGVGKSAILAWAADRASGCEVLRATGMESEMELPYAGLQSLCAPVLQGLDALPPPQAEALSVAFGLRSGEAPDRFLVGLAVLSLLAIAAESKPLLCLVDDAHWLDQASASVLAFVARRLVAESIGLVFAVREPVPEDFFGIEDLIVGPLDDADARVLLYQMVTGPMDAAVRERVIGESRGNPLALIELHRGMNLVEIAGGYGLSTRPALTSRIENSFVRRIAALPADTRLILLVAAVEPVGDPDLVMTAGSSLKLNPDAIIPALEGGLVELGAKLRFRHPLMRSAAARSGSLEERRAAHRALAEATDPAADPDRRAWHRGEATIGFDEDVAADLIRSAERAQSRGGLTAASIFQARGAELTPEPQLRSRRALMAAEDAFRAGAMHDALRLLELADSRLLDDHERARTQLVRAHVIYNTTRGREAPSLLLAAARSLEAHDSEAALATYVDAFIAALSAGTFAAGIGIEDVAEAILNRQHIDLADSWSQSTAAGLRGLGLLVTEGYTRAAPDLRDALDKLLAQLHHQGETNSVYPREPGRGLGTDLSSTDRAPRWMPLACLIARILLDDEAHERLSQEFMRLGRREGVFSFLPLATAERTSILLLSGRISDAEAQVGDGRLVIAATSAPASMTRGWWIAAFRGDAEAKSDLTKQLQGEILDSGEGQWFIAAAWLDAFLFNSLGRYSEALSAMDAAAGHPFDIGVAGWALPQHIEAAVRSGETERAYAPLKRLKELAQASGTDWACGEAALSAALLAEDDAAETLYREALERLTRTRVQTRLGHARVLFGEWLRRQNRRVDAREQLRLAHAMFIEMGAHALADRAGRELAATGEVVPKRTPGAADELTAQERQIVLLAAGGSTNPEIGAQLYLSPRTVEWHLRKVFTKMGITSRRQLASALREAPLPGA
ncbi:helix-turn-helix transcriptional regulator [Leifsonia flava]|nr:LuxR family transcriptional regulator [Leifsonia flava]